MSCSARYLSSSPACLASPLGLPIHEDLPRANMQAVANQPAPIHRCESEHALGRLLRTNLPHGPRPAANSSSSAAAAHCPRARAFFAPAAPAYGAGTGPGCRELPAAEMSAGKGAASPAPRLRRAAAPGNRHRVLAESQIMAGSTSGRFHPAL